MKKSLEGELFKKKDELERLSDDLEEKKRFLEDLKRQVEQFQRRYFSEVAQKQAELNILNAQLAEIMAKKTTYGHDGAKQKKPVMPSESFTDSYVSKKKGARVKLYNVQELGDAKKKYRSIASIIHPDKATESRSRPLRTRLMAELNEAYERRDTVRMQQIIDQWHESPEAVAGDNPAAELLRTDRAISLIKRKVSESEAEISRIKTSDIYDMMIKVYNAERTGRDIVAEMSLSINAQIQDVKNRILLGMYG